MSFSLSCPQAEPGARDSQVSGSDATMVVTRRDWNGSIRFSGLELGSGGLGKPVLAKAKLQNGQTLTPGGVLVRAQAAGVKLDFPSRQDLLIDRSGRVHLRTGQATRSASLGVQLFLADGARIAVVPSPGGTKPMRLVQVMDAKGSKVLWRNTRKARNAAARRRFLGESYLVLGDGDVLYRFVQVGPILVLERALCPSKKTKRYPARQVVVMGNVLGASLEMLPKRVPKHSFDFPLAHRNALQLAAQAKYLFPFGVQRRPKGALGVQVIGLARGYSLQLEVRGKGPVVIGLFHSAQQVPLAEWTVTTTTRLHLVKPDGGRDGRPRYFMRGIDLKPMIGDFAPVYRSTADLSRARRILREMGAADNASVTVQRR